MPVPRLVLPAVFAAALLALQACSEGPHFDAAAAVRVPPAPGLGRIFFYSTAPADAGPPPTVFVNGRAVGTVMPHTFFYIDRPPGPCTISTAAAQELALNFEPGRFHFVRFAPGQPPQETDGGTGAAEIAVLPYSSGPGVTQIATATAATLPRPTTTSVAPMPSTLPLPPQPTTLAVPAPSSAPAPSPAVRDPGPSPVAAPVAPSVTPAATDRVPYLDDDHQHWFQDYLASRKPGAFAISDNGHFAAIWSTPAGPQGDPVRRALDGCKAVAGKECVLYAVDDRIVFKGD